MTSQKEVIVKEAAGGRTSFHSEANGHTSALNAVNDSRMLLQKGIWAICLRKSQRLNKSRNNYESSFASIGNSQKDVVESDSRVKHRPANKRQSSVTTA